MESSRPTIQFGRLAGLVAILAIVAILWDRVPFLVAPLKLITVFFHELSHGIAALLTGGSIVGIQLSADGSGLCTTRGGSQFLVLNAGYLGSLGWGGLILVLAARTTLDRTLVAVAGGILITVSVIWIRPLAGFGFLSCIGAGAVLTVASRWLPSEANDWILRVIGLSGCLYVVLDLKAIVDGRMGLGSDAHALADFTGLPVAIWGIVWLVVGIGATLGFLLLAAAGPEERARRRAARLNATS